MENIKPVKNKFCKYLRARNPYGASEGGENPWLLFEDANTICWCIKSAGGAGPDNDVVTPHKCVSGRKCFKAPVNVNNNFEKPIL